jgi:hypothetical protein
MDRSTNRYEPRPDQKAKLCQKLIDLANQNRATVTRLHALLERQGEKSSPMRLFRFIGKPE